MQTDAMRSVVRVAHLDAVLALALEANQDQIQRHLEVQSLQRGQVQMLCHVTCEKQRDGVRPDPFKAVVAASRATDQPSSIAPGRNTGRSTGCVEVLLASPLSEPLGSLGIQGRETWRSRGVAALNDELSRGGLL